MFGKIVSGFLPSAALQPSRFLYAAVAAATLGSCSFHKDDGLWDCEPGRPLEPGEIYAGIPVNNAYNAHCAHH